MPEKTKSQALKTQNSKKNSTRFQPGKSGNPSGRPKRTQQEKDALTAIKALAPEAADLLKELMLDPGTAPAIKVRICELILDRAYGKTEAPVKVTSVAQSVEQSRSYILSLVQQVREVDANAQ